jgi:dUTP pyrophosphatase
MRIMMDKEIIYFAKVREDAIIPNKRSEDAGMDVYANFKEDCMVIKPHQTVMIPTGIASSCSKKYCFILKERGSTGTKGIAQRCGVIDSGYKNEWFIPITNNNILPIAIHKNVKDLPKGLPMGTIFYPYEKAICQALLIEVPEVDVKELSYEDLKCIESERGMGHLGSSGK